MRYILCLHSLNFSYNVYLIRSTWFWCSIICIVLLCNYSIHALFSLHIWVKIASTNYCVMQMEKCIPSTILFNEETEECGEIWRLLMYLSVLENLSPSDKNSRIWWPRNPITTSSEYMPGFKAQFEKLPLPRPFPWDTLDLTRNWLSIILALLRDVTLTRNAEESDHLDEYRNFAISHEHL